MQKVKSYLDKIALEIQKNVDPGAVLHAKDLPLYRIYAVLLLAKGQDVNAEDVHNAWTAWASEYEPENRNILPFKQLSPSVQDKDRLYVDVIHRVALSVQSS